MEKLNYIIEDKVISQLLGVQNFISDESAILELVKNAYDAKATLLTLFFLDNKLLVIDNGEGMDYDDIKNSWMYIGRSNKRYDILDANNRKRIQAGCKGIGRFALARLGENIEVRTKKEHGSGVVWKTDWNDSVLVLDNTIDKTGTEILIDGLREKWRKTRINNLVKYLESTYNDDAMRINIINEQYNINKFVSKKFPDANVGINCKSFIDLKYIDGILSINIESDEFEKNAEKYCNNIDIRKKEIILDVFLELKNNKTINGFELDEEEKRNIIMNIGGFSANFYFNFNSTKVEKEKFLYKHSSTREGLESGVILYRNAFSISTYEGSKDWLNFGKRSRRSPAAASHPTGQWRIRENQISGFVLIDKQKNMFLEDLSNRQGLDENIYYKLFVEIILLGITEFERYRQSIIRSIDSKNKMEELNEEMSIIQRLIKGEKYINCLNKEEYEQLFVEIKQYENNKSKSKIEQEEKEERYRYDVRLLNSLATSGLKAASIAHEINNNRNQIESSYEIIVEAMKKYDIWDIVNKPENTKIVCENIPKLLKNNHDSAKKIIGFIDAILERVEKSQFRPQNSNIKDAIDNIAKDWQKDYSLINIKVNIEDDLFFNISKDIFYTIFENLILNSIQQNEDFKRELNIVINANKGSEGELKFEYIDDGKGLCEKYLKNPRIILEPHESSRCDGHGLGMWIVNNTINFQKGEIVDISGHDGFKFIFYIKDIK